ncbi:MAG: gliding motility-associated C-terminal domain-containing protein, partial [Luteibaculum sp.]
IDVELPQFPYLNAEILVVPATNEISIENPSVFIVNSTVGATGGSWDIRDQDTSVTVGFTPGDNFELHFPDTGDYVIKLVVFNGGGLCSDSVTFKMKVAKIVTVFIPNAFTPNRDGDNDVWPNGQTNDFGNWTPKGYDLIDFEVSIHNRWGEQVFSTERVPNAPWNGNYFNRTNVPCEPGVYSYRAKLFFDEFNHQTVMGTITLLR